MTDHFIGDDEALENLLPYLWHDYLGPEVTPMPAGLPTPSAPWQLLTQRLQGHEEVLDLGCGVGGAALSFARRAQSVVGVDRSMTRIEWARRLTSGHKCRVPVRASGPHLVHIEVSVAPPAGELRFACHDVETWAFEERQYDAVHIGALYDLVTDPTGLLTRARAALRPGGWLLTWCPYQFAAADRHPHDPAQDVRQQVHALGMTVVQDVERLWVLRHDHYRFNVYRVHAVLAQVSVSSEPE